MENNHPKQNPKETSTKPWTQSTPTRMDVSPGPPLPASHSASGTQLFSVHFLSPYGLLITIH